MKPSTACLNPEIETFIAGSAAGLVQLLVAAARRSTFDRIIACPTYPAPVRSAGLNNAVRQFRESLESDELDAPTFLARLYASARSIKHRKRTGQFFTSAEVAEWALSLEKPMASDNICDAGAGTGAFAHAVLRTGDSVKSYTGVENDPILALCAAHALESLKAPTSFRVWYANFLLLKHRDFELQGVEPPTLVIANPPFVRFHNLSGRARIRKDLRSSLGLSLSALSGSGNYFLSRAVELTHIAPTSGTNGNLQRARLMFFLPKEAEGAAHAKRLREDLKQMHGWSCDQIKVPLIQTGVDRHPSNSLALLFIFKRQKPISYSGIPEAFTVGSVQDLIRIKRGISTGCNDFFVLTDDEARLRRIPQRYLRKVLPTRIPITSSEISAADWEKLRKSGHACWLLSLPQADIDDFESPVREYLKDGLRRGVHETPTARLLRTWFSIPIPAEPPDLFITYLFRSAPRFVLNRARVVHLTNILGARFVASVVDQIQQEAITAALNRLAHTWMRNAGTGREYKRGLFKIEPRELSMLPVDKETLNLIHWHAEPRPLSLFGQS